MGERNQHFSLDGLRAETSDVGLLSPNAERTATARRLRWRIKKDVGGHMLVKHHLMRNPYFHFHPLPTLVALLAAVILFGLMIWILAVPAQ